jgi:hypothetical protein
MLQKFTKVYWLGNSNLQTEAITLYRNVGHQSPNDAASGRMKKSTARLRKPKISQIQ